MHISSLSSSAAGLSLSSPLAVTAFLAMAVQGLISSAEIVEHDVSQEDPSQTSPPELVTSSLPAGMHDALYPACSHALWSLGNICGISLLLHCGCSTPATSCCNASALKAGCIAGHAE